MRVSAMKPSRRTREPRISALMVTRTLSSWAPSPLSLARCRARFADQRHDVIPYRDGASCARVERAVHDQERSRPGGGLPREIGWDGSRPDQLILERA